MAVKGKLFRKDFITFPRNSIKLADPAILELSISIVNMSIQAQLILEFLVTASKNYYEVFVVSTNCFFSASTHWLNSAAGAAAEGEKKDLCRFGDFSLA